MQKLLKYEIRKTRFSKIILLILTVLSELFFLFSILLFPNQEKYLMFAILCLGFCATLGTLACGLHSVDQLYRELNSKQSYMLFMTPNNSYKILGAKILENGISLAVSGLFFGILALVDLLIVSIRLTGPTITMNDLFSVLGRIQLDPTGILNALVAILSFWLMIITIAFFSVILQATLLNGKRLGGLIGFLLFIAINVVLSIIVGNIPVFGNAIVQSIINGIFIVFVVVGFYILSGWIMDKKLNV